MSPGRLVDALAREVGSRTVAYLLIISWLVAIGATMITVGFYLSLRDTQDRVTALVESNKQQGDDLVQAVCTLRADYTKRITDGQAFLKANPQGIVLPSGRITAAQLRLNIENMKRTRAALTSVDCVGISVPSIQPTLPPPSSAGSDG